MEVDEKKASDEGQRLSEEESLRADWEAYEKRKREFIQANKPTTTYHKWGDWDRKDSNSWMLLMTLVSAFLTSFSISNFVNNSQLLPGGLNGVSLLLQRVFSTFMHREVSYGFINIVLNIIPAIIAFRTIGHRFVFFSVINIVLGSVFVDLWPNFHFTDDIVLNVAFAAAVSGLGVSIALNAGTSTGGTDFIFMAISNKYNVALWNYSFLFNALILIISGLLFDYRPAMYSVIYQYIKSLIVAHYHSRYMKLTLFIVTDKSEPMASDLVELTHHSITKMEGVGEFTGEPRVFMFMLIGKDDLPKVKTYLQHCRQPKFVDVIESESIEGRFYMKPLD